MAHFAEIDTNNIVKQVVVIPDEQEDRGQEYLANDLDLGGVWIKTSYNTFGGIHLKGGEPLRKNYAGIGFTYDTELDAFYEPQPFISWILNEETCQWEAPVVAPNAKEKSINQLATVGENHYVWNEETQSWDKLPTE
jgi:hypothetical protein